MSLEASTSNTASHKKRKHGDIASSSQNGSPKKHKKERDGKEKKSKRRKHDGQFKVVNASVQVSIPPRFALDPIEGAIEMLDSLVMKYVPALQGVLLCHSNASFTSRIGVIKNECPFINCTLAFEATVWSPQIGMKLMGRINLHSPDHISLLVNRTFNVSIPREHIRTDDYAFEHGAAENDPEFGWGITNEPTEGVQAWKMKQEGDDNDADDMALDVSAGAWVHKTTGERLGGPSRMVEFTVIGLTVANQMLSLRGSIQPDPFSPEHVPRSVVPTAAVVVDEGKSDNEDKDEDQMDPFAQRPSDLEEDSDDEDVFREYRREKAVAPDAYDAQREREEKEKEERDKLKQEKRKRKQEKRERKEREKAETTMGTDERPLAVSNSEDKPQKKKREKVKAES